MILRPALGLFMAMLFAVFGISVVRFLYAAYGFELAPVIAGAAFTVAFIAALAFAFPWRPE